MRCKKHTADLSSSSGVCASCLRERLCAIIQAQLLREAQQDCRKSDPQPPQPLPFPRSVSPYISRRKSDSTTATTWQPHDQRRFYSTPQIGPNASITVEIKKSSGRRFSSLLLRLFRSKSEIKPDLESGPVTDPIDYCSASPAWFPNIIPSRRKKKPPTASVHDGTCRHHSKGMSPARHEDEHCQSCGHSQRTTPSSTRRGGGRPAGHSKSVSGLAFCLSPLVRPGPNHHWNHQEMVVTGDSRVTPKPHLSTAASFGKNRSRKLADFGRYAGDLTF